MVSKKRVTRTLNYNNSKTAIDFFVPYELCAFKTIYFSNEQIHFVFFIRYCCTKGFSEGCKNIDEGGWLLLFDCSSSFFQTQWRIWSHDLHNSYSKHSGAFDHMTCTTLIKNTVAHLITWLAKLLFQTQWRIWSHDLHNSYSKHSGSFDHMNCITLIQNTVAHLITWLA